jgi:hypothetical protein
VRGGSSRLGPVEAETARKDIPHIDLVLNGTPGRRSDSTTLWASRAYPGR